VATDPGDMSKALAIPVITVTGKAYFDVGHSLKDQRSKDRAAWEIHPVMKLELGN
jgi:hypothetical protein